MLQAAIALADEAGIEALSMRKLAKELGVEAMSLYNHVSSKDDLLNGIVDLVVGEIELPAADGDWRDAIRKCAISAHDVLLRHRWACTLVLAPADNPTLAVHHARLRYMEWLLGTLRSAAFPLDLTYHAYHAVDSHILGFTLWQLGHSIRAEDVGDLATTFLGQLPANDFPHLIEHIHQHLDAASGDGQREFEFLLDLILDGLERARARAASAT